MATMTDLNDLAAQLYGSQGATAPAAAPARTASAQPQTRPQAAQANSLQALFPDLDISKVTDPNYMMQFSNPDEGSGDRYLLKGVDGNTYGLNSTLGADPADGGSINVTHHYGEGDAGGGQYYEFGRDGNMLAGREYKNDPNGMRDFIGMGLMMLAPVVGGAMLGAAEGAGAGGAEAAGGVEAGGMSGMDIAADTPGFGGAWSAESGMSGMDLAADGTVGNAPQGLATNSAAETAAGQSGMDLAADGAPGNAWGVAPDSGIDWNAVKNGYQLGSLLGGLAKPQAADLGGGGVQQPVGTGTSLQSGATAGGSATGTAVGGVAGSQPGVANTLLTTFADDDDAAKGGRTGSLLGG